MEKHSEKVVDLLVLNLRKIRDTETILLLNPFSSLSFVFCRTVPRGEEMVCDSDDLS